MYIVNFAVRRYNKEDKMKAKMSRRIRMQEHLGIDTVKEGKRFFSTIGFLYLAGSVIIWIVQDLTIGMVHYMKPELLQNNTLFMMLPMLSMYILGMPMLIFLVSRMKTEKKIAVHKMSVGKLIMAAIMCYGIMYAGNLAGNFLTMLIGLFKGSAVTNEVASMVAGNAQWAVFFLTVLCAPVYEEVIFRKLIIDRAVVYGEGTAVVLSGIMFGLFHGNLNQFAYAFFLGLFLAFIYVKTGRLRYTVILHMAVNFVGSVVSVWILNASRFSELPGATSLLQTNVAEGMAKIRELMPGIVLITLYSLAVIGTAAAGITLLIAYRKSFRLLQGEKMIPQGRRFAVVALNAGMLLFTAFWLIQMVMQLMA